MNGRISTSLLLMLFMAMFLSSPVNAEFRLTPSLLVGEEYNDNIYLDSEDEESDFITTLSPNLHLLWSTRIVDLNLDWGLRFRYYLDNSEENEDSLDQTQRARLDADFSLYRDALFLQITDTYERVPVDESGKGGIGNDLVNLTDSNTLVVNPYLKLQPWRTVTTRLDYVYTNVWYDDPEGIDSQSHTGSFSVTKELTPRLSMTLTGSRTWYRPDTRSDSLTDTDDDVAQEYDRDDAQISLVYLLTSRLTLSAYYGKAWIDYREESDQDLDLWGLNARYQLTEEVAFGGGYDVSTSHTVSEGMVETKGANAFVEYSRRNKVRLRGHYQTSDYLTQDREDDSWGVAVDGDIPWTNRMGSDYQLAFTRFDNQDALESDEKYKRYSFRLGIYRDMRIGRFRLGYTFNENQSDNDSNDYTNNIVYADMRFVF